MKLMIGAACALLAAASMAPAPARAQGEASPKVRTAAFLEMVATRGRECGRLRSWQAAALRALNLEDMSGWSFAQREAMIAESERQLAEAGCDNEAMTLWIDGARRGFEAEMLAPYLVAYLTLVGYEDPPPLFTKTTTRIRYGPAVQAIRDKLAALEASGAAPEGGGSWEEYIDKTGTRVRALVAAFANDEADPRERRDAGAWIGQTAHIVELWLAEEAG